MIRKKVGEIEFLQFELLSGFPQLRHGIFLRHGGVSSAPFSSLSLGGKNGDTPENIRENRKRILSALGATHYVSGDQTHSKEVKQIETLDYPGVCDGLITSQTEVALLLNHADCQIAIFYDPIEQAIANVHAGWRGNVQNIYRETIQKMRHAFGSLPQNLLVGISPSLGPEYAEFKNYKVEFPESFWDFQIRPDYFNLWEIARSQLEAEGVLPHHIQIASLCTYTESNDFFSYRRDKLTGRNGTVVLMNKNPV